MDLGNWAVHTADAIDFYAEVYVDPSEAGYVCLRDRDGALVRRVGGELLHLERVDVPWNRR